MKRLHRAFLVLLYSAYGPYAVVVCWARLLLGGAVAAIQAIRNVMGAAVLQAAPPGPARTTSSPQ